MASTGSGRGPIKVGSGYIDVFPKLNEKQLRETRAQIEKQMGATGKAAGKALSEGISTQIATIPKKAKAAAEKAQREIQKSALDSKKVLSRIEKELTKEYGAEAGKRFREAAELEKKKQKLLDQTSASTRRALQTTLREEQETARNTARAWQTAERERVAQIRERQKVAERAARDEAAANRRAQQQMRDDIRRTLTEARAARLAELQGQMDAQRDQVRALRAQLQGYRRQMDDHTRAVGRGLTNLQTGWRHQGEAIERLGTNITETGRLITTHLLAPLGAVSAVLTTIGVQSADMRVLGQLGLTAAGVSKKTSAKEMRKIQEYAIATPFSIDTMHEYQMKLIRSIAGNDKSWYNPKTKGKAADRAASKTSDIIMAVGDTMARAGNLDPNMFARAMYAVDRIMDMDKAPTRNINQLVQATGIPAGELAQMFGFSSAGAFWKQVGTPVAKGGGISGHDMINNLLRFWDPKYFVMGKNGKPKIDPKTGQPILNTAPHDIGEGSKGYGEKMTAATITGRVQQLKERAQFELGSLFAKENPKTGEYEYTKLGESIMGKKTPVYKHDRRGELIATGEYTYEGGLLQKIGDLGKDQKGNVLKLLQTSFEAAGKFVDQIKGISDWLEAHPKVKESFASILKMGAAVLPWVLAVGLMTKTFGKLNKILASALTPLGMAFKGLQGVTRVGRQVAAGVQSRRDGNGFLQGYRDRRTQLRGGDTRGPIARTRDRVTGRDSGLGNLRGQIRDTEDAIRATEERITGLQRQIREVNRTRISDLVNQFAGSGRGGGLQGSAQNAGQAVNGAQNQVQQLNRQGLGQVRGEFESTEEKAEHLRKKVEAAKDSVGHLNNAKLVSLRVQFDTTHGTVDDLKAKIEHTATSVKQLDERKLGTLREQQIATTKNQADNLKGALSHAASEVGTLNGKRLTDVRKQIDSTTSAGHKLVNKIKEVIGRVNALNGRSLATIRNAFHGGKSSLYNAVNDVYKALGTKNSGVNGRVSDLNGRSLKTITGNFEALKKAIDETDDKAKSLNSNLDNISKHAPGKGGTGNTKKPPKHRKATGGVLPGYTPGRDVHTFISPTAGTLELSGGEAIMRPEFTAAIGPEAINRLNAVARTQGVAGIRKSMKFAEGGILDKLGLRPLMENLKNFNVWTDAVAAFSTMDMSSASRGIGGDAQTGVLSSGRDGSHFVGADLGGRFKGMYDYITKDTWELLKKAPVPDGFSQVIGVLGGALSPIAGDLLWNDVWKGNGNILERGARFVDHLISGDTVKKLVGNLFGGFGDTVKSLWQGGTAFLSDPIGTITDSVSGVWDMVVGEYDRIVDMVKTMRSIWTSPKDYADMVIRDIYDTAKENLPNLEGLFDFSGSGLSSKKPDVRGLVNNQISTPGTGSSVTRWTPQVQMVLRQLGLPLSDTGLVLHRIQVESGGNPRAINLWDINAKMGHPSAGLMQTIPSTFNAYAGPYKSRGIYDPLASIYAGLNYATHRYGSGWRKALSGTSGYWTGTLSASPGLALVGERGPELVDFGKGGQRVYNNRETEAMLGGSDRPINLTINEAKHETNPQAILRGFQWIDSMYGNRL